MLRHYALPLLLLVDYSVPGSERAVATAVQSKLVVCSLLAACAAVLWTLLIFHPTLKSRVISVSQVLAGTFLGVNALVLFVSGYVLLACVITIVIVGDALWVRRARAAGKVQFSEVLLDVVMAALRFNPVLLSIALGCLVAQHAYFIAWSALLIDVLRTGTGEGDLLLLGLLLFLLRWTIQVFKGVVRVVVSGTTAEWLRVQWRDSNGRRGAGGEAAQGGRVVGGGAGSVLGDTGDLEHANSGATGSGGGGTDASESVAAQPSSKAALRRVAVAQLCRALTLQLGSICAGAAVGAAAAEPILWACVRALRRLERSGSPRVSRFASRATDTVEAMLRACHKYGYVQVAERGKTWFQSARDTWEAFGARGVEAVVAEDSTDRMLLFGCYIGGAALALIMGVTLHAGVRSWVLIGAIIFWYGFAGVSLALTPIESAVSTVFVCFAENPELISTAHPIIFHRLVRVSEVAHFERSHRDRL